MDFIILGRLEIDHCIGIGLVVTVISIAAIVCFRFFYVDIPKIKNIPEIPNGDLLAGHLYKLGVDHATTAEKWATRYGWPVYQLRMGRRRAVMLNSFDAASDWMVKNQSATLDRPWFYTFHGVVSKTSGERKL
jgi:phenylacetate 2-hydroxylase